MLRKLTALILLASAAAFGQGLYRIVSGPRLSPTILNYQGFLTDTLGNPISSPPMTMAFSIYDSATGGAALWSESQGVAVNKGIFHVLLGATAQIPDTIFTRGTSRWLGLTVDGNTLLPRTRITSVPYAYTATYSDTAVFARNGSGGSDNDWVIIGSDVYSGVPGNVGIGTSTPRYKLDVIGVICGGTSNTVSNPHGGALAGYNNQAGYAAEDTAAVCVGGWNNLADYKYSFVGGGRLNATKAAFATVVGGYADTASGLYSVVTGGGYNKTYGMASVIAGGWGNNIQGMYATIGGGENNRARGEFSSVLGGSNNQAYSALDADTGATIAGGVCNTAGGNWSFIGGGANNTIEMGNYGTIAGGHFNYVTRTGGFIGGGEFNTSTGPYSGLMSGTGNFAGNDTCDTAAVVTGGFYNEARAKFTFVGGGTYNRAHDNFTTVAGGAANQACSLFAFVGGGQINSAVWMMTTVGGGGGNTAYMNCATVGGGYLNRADSGWSFVGGGEQNKTAGNYAAIGGGYQNLVQGHFSTVAGGEFDTIFGAGGFAAGSHSVIPFGFNNSAALNGQAVTSSGQTRVNILSKVSGTFSIDHPLDPRNKILNHYFVESPEMVLIYRGIVRIGGNGRATIHLPDYFDALNQNPMVQLTAVGTPETPYLVENVRNNQFVIAGKPGSEVHWLVTGERKDPSAEATRILMPVEQVKTGDLAGRSLDDNFLYATMAQLETMGYGGRFSFRTAAARKNYEDFKKRTGGGPR